MACENFSLVEVSSGVCGLGSDMHSHSFGELLGGEELVALGLKCVGHGERRACDASRRVDWVSW